MQHILFWPFCQHRLKHRTIKASSKMSPNTTPRRDGNRFASRCLPMYSSELQSGKCTNRLAAPMHQMCIIWQTRSKSYLSIYFKLFNGITLYSIICCPKLGIKNYISSIQIKFPRRPAVSTFLKPRGKIRNGVTGDNFCCSESQAVVYSY